MMRSDLTLYLVTGVCLILQILLTCWRWGRSKTVPAAPTPTQRKREPKSFAGYTHKPECELCGQGIDSQGHEAPGAPPPRMIFTRGRRRTVNTTGHFYPQPNCSYRGWVGFGNIRANGHPNRRRWRQLVCLSCHGYFLETVGTPFHARQVDPDKLVWAITAVAEGVGIRAVARRIVFGSREVIESILAKRGWKINTSFVERVNLGFRQHVAAIGRRVNTLCKHEAGLRQQVAIFHVYHNFVLPHASLRLPIPETAAIRCWRPQTPVMAAGLTDRVWSVRDILMYRVPPWPQSQVG